MATMRWVPCGHGHAGREMMLQTLHTGQAPTAACTREAAAAIAVILLPRAFSFSPAAVAGLRLRRHTISRSLLSLRKRLGQWPRRCRRADRTLDADGHMQRDI